MRVTNVSSAETIFLRARELTDSGEQRAYLDRECGRDPALRAEVQALLADADAAEAFFDALDEPHQQPGAGQPLSEEPETVLGRYKLLQKIGEGGMGVVYMAEQSEPVRRKVALKVIKQGMDTRQVVARFEAERQALALMDHPNVAKVLDGGATDAGRPYFVMELVRGIPITQYCDQARLSTSDRLNLFLEVCSAIEHAHQKGIIHRDIKPSNILVTLHGDKPVPKIIDFGIAKAIQQPLTDKTLFTQFQQFVGTPAYTSPEQASLSGLDVDTRSDIYGLGVLLYELLTGRTPFDGKALLAVGLEGMRRTIQEFEPARPSNKLSTLEGEDLTQAARARAAEPIKLIQSIRGDLDWIVMKCLEKDRARRYATVTGLAADLRRHLTDEPVLARPPSALYRFSKIARRHRGAFAAGLSIVVLLVAGLLSVSSLLVRAKQAEGARAAQLARAEKAENDRREELWSSLHITAQASRQSGEAGRRFASLQAVRQASAIRPSLALRNEAIAALALTDLGPARFSQAMPWLGEKAPEADAVFDRDVRRVALNDLDGSIQIHRVDDHLKLLHIPASRDFALGEATRMLFSPDDRCLAARGENGVIRCWQLEPFRKILEAKQDAGFWNSLAFSADSRYLVAGRTDGQLAAYPIKLALAAADAPIREPAWKTNLGLRAWCIAFDRSNTRFAILWGDRAEVWRWPERTRLQTLPLGFWGESAAWHPDGQHLWTVGEKGIAKLWEISGHGARDLKGFFEHLPHVVLHPRGDFVATYSYFGATRLWGMTDEGPMLAAANGLARTFSRDGSRLGFFHTSKRYGYWPVEPSRTHRSFAGASGGRGSGNLDFSPDGSVLIWCDSFGFWSLDLRTGGYRRYPAESHTRAHFTAAGDRLVVGGRSGLRVQPVEVDRSSGDAPIRWRGPATPVPGGEFPIHGQHSAPLNRRHFAASEPLSRRMVILDEQGGSEAFSSPYAPAVLTVAISPDRKWLALSHWNGGTCVLDLRTKQVVRAWPELTTAYVTFSPDGAWLVIGTTEEYRFWRSGTWEPGRPIARGLQTSLGSPLAFSQNGRLIATVKGLNTVELHDATTGETLAALEPPSAQMLHSLAFNPQGNLLATIGISALHLWDLAEIRRELKSLGLDWNHPPIPDPEIPLGDLTFRYIAEAK